MTRHTFSLSILVILITNSSPASASDKQSAQILSRQVVDSLISIQPAKADLILSQLELEYPDFSMNGFYRAAAIWALAQDARGSQLKILQSSASQALKKSIKEAKKHLQKSPDNPDWEMSLGMSHTFIGRLYLQQNRWIKAYHHIRLGRDVLRELLNKSPNYSDAWFTLGLYEYYSGSAPKHLKWLAKIIDLSGNRQLGIEYIIRSIKTSQIASPEAARILLDEIRPLSCSNLGLAKQMKNKYSINPQFSLILQKLQIYCGYPVKALNENNWAQKEYLNKFPHFSLAFDKIRLAALASIGNAEEISNSSFHKSIHHNLILFYKAKALDVDKKRQQALSVYETLEESDTLNEWQLKRVIQYIHKPFTPPKPAQNVDNGLRITGSATNPISQ